MVGALPVRRASVRRRLCPRAVGDSAWLPSPRRRLRKHPIEPPPLPELQQGDEAITPTIRGHASRATSTCLLWLRLLRPAAATLTPEQRAARSHDLANGPAAVAHRSSRLMGVSPSSTMGVIVCSTLSEERV
jgi:hypothetical protein